MSAATFLQSDSRKDTLHAGSDGILSDSLFTISMELCIILAIFVSWTLLRNEKRTENTKLPDNEKPLKDKDEKFDIVARCHNEFTLALRHYRDRTANAISDHSAIFHGAIRCGHSDICAEVIRRVSKEYNGKPPSVMFCEDVLKRFHGRQWYALILETSSVIDLPLDVSRVCVLYLCSASVAQENLTMALFAANKLYHQDGCLNPKEMSSLLFALSRNKMWKEMLAVFQKLCWDSTADKHRSTSMLNIMLSTLVTAGQHKIARSLLLDSLKAVHGSFPTPDVVSFNTVLKNYTCCVDEIMELLPLMEEYHILPDNITFGTVLDICVANKNMDKAAWVLDHFFERGLQMNTVLYTTIIKGYVYSNRLDMAIDTFEQMLLLPQAQPDMVTFAIMIRAMLEQRNVDEALSMLERMKQVNLLPDNLIITSLLEGCIYENKPACGIKLFEDHFARGGGASSYTCTSMIKLYGKAGFHAQAFDFVTSMYERFGVKPGTVAFTCLMSGAIHAKDFKNAWSAYDLMCQFDVAGDMRTYTTLLASAAGYPSSEEDVRKKITEVMRRIKVCKGSPAAASIKRACKILREREFSHLIPLIEH